MSPPSDEVRYPITNPPLVDADSLFGHITALASERYTQAEREQARAYLVRTLQQLGWSPLSLPFETGVNLLAQRVGTDPTAGAILVAAHYDTVPGSPGADDNASGLAVVLEVARLLRSRPTARSLQVAFFDREEAGLLGSRAFVGNRSLLEDLRGVIVLDMIGFACRSPGCQRYPDGLPPLPLRDQGDFLAVLGDLEHSPLLKPFQAASMPPDLPPVLTLPVPLRGALLPDTLRSDHAPFWLKGIGALLVSDTANLRSPHYHQPSDTIGTLDSKFLAGAAQLVINATTALLESTAPTEATPVNIPTP
ncbi:M20/M25/M40 family metallo-hydrolase [Leptolyngbya sp. FACHB-261]|uniref:M20/M25/M40 family metallo-hydrolase n=1 Tax=Leptolyngbya sp. FACHB-261 TaxID=2692806 RepID=UPI0018F0467A|nr:M20/M25/M40 family metallo-hydrolase [Leptolyngbya sp. FACHB-261]